VVSWVNTFSASQAEAAPDGSAQRAEAPFHKNEFAYPKNYIPTGGALHYNARLSKFSAPDRRGMLIALMPANEQGR